jgi:DNA replication protein DnaC
MYRPPSNAARGPRRSIATLADLLESECEDRDARRKVRRVKEANFPRPKRIEDFDFSKNTNVPQEVINTLTQPAWVQAGNPLCLIGDSGTGKSHLLIGLGTAIAEAVECSPLPMQLPETVGQ